jgi:hypothetical protein
LEQLRNLLCPQQRCCFELLLPFNTVEAIISSPRIVAVHGLPIFEKAFAMRSETLGTSCYRRSPLPYRIGQKMIICLPQSVPQRSPGFPAHGCEPRNVEEFKRHAVWF